MGLALAGRNRCGGWHRLAGTGVGAGTDSQEQVRGLALTGRNRRGGWQEQALGLALTGRNRHWGWH